jgi:hypothetical protein
VSGSSSSSPGRAARVPRGSSSSSAARLLGAPILDRLSFASSAVDEVRLVRPLPDYPGGPPGVKP